MDGKTAVDMTMLRNELGFVLEKLVGLHRQLIGLLREELSHMVSMAVKELTEVTHSKEAVLFEIWNHEQLRIATTEKICKILGKDSAATSLTAITKVLGDLKLQATGDALLLLLQEAKVLNKKNMEFVTSSLERIEQLKRNVLGITNNQNENYSEAGTRQAPSSPQGGRLLSTEA